MEDNFKEIEREREKGRRFDLVDQKREGEGDPRKACRKA
jgi:hypothetical protein